MRVLRDQAEQFKGCGECGARARWVELPQGPDYWSMPCVHKGAPVDLTRVTLVLGERK